MSPTESTSPTIDTYIAGFPEDIQARLERIRQVIREAAPGAVETISYGMPTFKLNGKNLVHFAAYQRHIGFYPTPSGIDAFEDEIAVYRDGKGTLRLPLDEPVPYDLIARITAFRAEENEAQAAAKRKK